MLPLLTVQGTTWKCAKFDSATQGTVQEAVIVYARPEDEFYHKHSSWSYTFPISGREVEKDELQPLRMVLGISAKQADLAR